MAAEKTTVPATRTDGELLAAFVQRQDESAFAQLVGRHGGMVLGVCRSLAGAAEAENAAQAVFLALAQKAKALQRHRSVAGWLYRVSTYTAANARRAQCIRRRHERRAAAMRPNVVEPNSPDDPRLDRLHESLAMLPHKYRIALILHHLQGQTQDQTAAIIGCSRAAAAVRLSRGRKMLRDRMAKWVIIPSADLPALLGAAGSTKASAMFVGKVTHAALAIASGQSVITSPVIHVLAKSTMKTLFLEKIKVAVLIAAVFLLSGGIAATVCVLASTRASPARAVMPMANPPAVNFFVDGDVMRPGAYAFPADGISLRKALASAGGKRGATDVNVQIRRKLVFSKTFTFNSYYALVADPFSATFSLRDGDVIMVGSASAIVQTHDPHTGGKFQPTPSIVMVGAVRQPGEYALPPTGMDFQQLVGYAGGKSIGRDGPVYIIRSLQPDRLWETIKYDSFDKLLGEPGWADLRNKDIVVVGNPSPQPANVTQPTTAPASAHASISPETMKAIDSYAKNLEWEKSVSLTTDDHIAINNPFPPNNITEQDDHVQFDRDGDSLCFNVTTHNTLVDSDRSHSVITGHTMLSYQPSPAGNRLEVVRQSADNRCRFLMLEPYIGPLDGYVGGCKEDTIADVLRNTKGTHLRDKPETIEGESCVVIEAAGPEGRFTVWLSPRQNYALVKMTAVRGPNDLLKGRLVSTLSISPRKEDHFAEISSTLDHLETKQFGNFWVACKGMETITSRLCSGRTEWETDTWTRSSIDLRPNFAVIQPFTLSIPDGTPVIDLDHQHEGKSYVWLHGKIEAIGSAGR